MLETIKSIFGIYSAGQGRYTNQVLNKIRPFGQCFANCTAQFLNIFGIDKTADQVMQEINTDYYFNWTIKNIGYYAAQKYKTRLNEIWKTQQHYISKQLNTDNIIFNSSTKIYEIKEAIKRKSPVIVGTTPMYHGRQLGHIMIVTDYQRVTDSFQVDDPLGDFRINYAHDLYEQGRGNNLIVSVKSFQKILTNLSIYRGV